MILRKYWHIGVAVDTPDGLVVAVVKDVDQKGVIELARELGELSEKARAGKLAPAEMQGATFTISSLGGIGGVAFTPIVNAPEVAILGVVRVEEWPRLGRRGRSGRGSCCRSASPTTTASSTGRRRRASCAASPASSRTCGA